MLSSTNFLMGFAGLIYFVAGVFILRKEISAARGWDKLITLGCVFIAVPLAVFAPEHFQRRSEVYPDGKTGINGYHEGKGTPQGASYLYWLDSKQDSGALENFLKAPPGRVALWLGAHTHTAPDDTYGGKSHIERRWGTTFINVAGLTKYMGAAENCVRSWLLTFTDSSEEVTAQCYAHTSDHVPQGWYPKFDRVIKLSKQFKMPSV